MKETIVKLLKKPLKKIGLSLKEEEIEKLITIPPFIDMGDYSFPCMSFARQLKMEPHEIVLDLREKIGKNSRLSIYWI